LGKIAIIVFFFGFCDVFAKTDLTSSQFDFDQFANWSKIGGGIWSRQAEKGLERASTALQLSPALTTKGGGL
jgi:hypothetical protein